MRSIADASNETAESFNETSAAAYGTPDTFNKTARISNKCYRCG
jgi:hypothetical protein